MAAVVVVGVQEVWQGRRSIGVAGVGAGVGPLVEQGAVEAFDFADGLRPLGAGEIAGRAELGQGLLPGEALVGGPGIVGRYPLDAVDPAGGEEGHGPAQEAGAGGGLLVAVDLAVGQAGVVVDGGVDVVGAHVAASGPAGPAAAHLVTAAVGDPAELLDVDVDQFAGPVAFVAADELSGEPVQEGQTPHVVGCQADWGCAWCDHAVASS